MRISIFRTKSSMALAALAAAMLVNLSMAQDKPAAVTAASQPTIYIVNAIRVQPGMVGEWQDLIKKEMIPALQKGGLNQLSVWRTATFGENSNDFIIARPIRDAAQLDEPNPIVKELGREGATALMTRATRISTSLRTFMIISRPDLSIAPASGYVPKLAVMAVSSITPGRTAEYEKAYKEVLLPIFRKTNAKGVLSFKGVLGGDPNEYGSLALFDSFADLAQFPAAFAKARAEAKPEPMPQGIVVHTEQTTVRLVPDLSIQPPQLP